MKIPIFSVWEDAQRQTIQDYILIAKWVVQAHFTQRAQELAQLEMEHLYWPKAQNWAHLLLHLRHEPKNLRMRWLLTWHHVLSPCL
jgi:hypothetical protein